MTHEHDAADSARRPRNDRSPGEPAHRVIARRLATLTTRPTRTAVIAQVATDARTGCLGIAMVYGPGQLTSIRFTEHLELEGIAPSIGTVGTPTTTP